MSLFILKIVLMFYFIGDKVIIFICLIDVQFNFDLVMIFQSYYSSDFNCIKSVIFKILFFSLFLLYEEWSVDVYEVMFGYYLQV